MDTQFNELFNVDITTALRKSKSKQKLPTDFKEYKKKLIVDALLRNEGRINETAAELGITRGSLWRHRKQMGLI